MRIPRIPAYARQQHPHARFVTAAVDQIQVLAPAEIRRDIRSGRFSISWAVPVWKWEFASSIPTVRRASPPVTSPRATSRWSSARPMARRVFPLAPFEPEDEIACRRWEKARGPEAAGFDKLLAERLQTSGWERMFPEHENVPRKAYEQSSLCAELIAPHRPILVSVNRIHFKPTGPDRRHAPLPEPRGLRRQVQHLRAS